MFSSNVQKMNNSNFRRPLVTVKIPEQVFEQRSRKKKGTIFLFVKYRKVMRSHNTTSLMTKVDSQKFHFLTRHIGDLFRFRYNVFPKL